ncbi:N-acetylneuraminate synthase family protein [Thioalkalivibrio sp. ALMg11]|uniref:N-acetylneuraminate synthase family protein n=1 Tax=Thioalkalivibrio sp. ALMg11 TaxID=1158165 RepID=UPI0009DAB544|nr:N-acetylneuraminate synthase family protein [Thioalkalivibrio sp. ALMg11]
MTDIAMPEIIAEAGSNHNGSIKRAKTLVDLAADVGASSVKFQLIFSEGLYLPQLFNGVGYVDNPVFRQRKSEELSEAEWSDLWGYAHERGISISGSVFCEKGVDLLGRLGAPYVKIASTDLTNHELIGRACDVFGQVIVSTGMATLEEIAAMVNFVQSTHPGTELRLMHCVSAYPCALRDANVQRVAMLSRCFGVPVGYSDHTRGEVSAGMALAHGAEFFEKHFTTDRDLPGFDHAHALDGPELASYVQTLRDGAASLARPANEGSAQEQITKLRARRGVYAARVLPEGHVLKREDLLFVRPSTECSFNGLADLIGSRLQTPVSRYAALGIDASSARIVQSNWEGAQSYWGREMEEKGMGDGTGSVSG